MKKLILFFLALCLVTLLQAQATNSVITATACGTYTVNGSSYTSTGQYTQTLKNVAGYDSVITLNVTINALPTYTITGGATYCYGATILPIRVIIDKGIPPYKLTYTDGFNFSHTVNVTGTNPIPYIVAERLPGVYQVTSITDASPNACSATIVSSNITTINIIPQLIITPIAQTPFCAKTVSTIPLSSLFTFSPSGGTTSYTCNDASAISAGSFTKTSIAGTYSVSATYTLSGCSNVASNTIIVNPLPTVTATANPAVLCVGAKTSTLTAIGANSYLWSNAINMFSQVVTPNYTQSYIVTGTDANGCVNTATASVSIAYSAIPVITTSITYLGSSEIISAGIFNQGTATFIWGNGITGTSQTVYPTSTTSYFVTGTDNNGCKGTGTATVLIRNQTLPINPNAPTDIVISGGSGIASFVCNSNNAYVWGNNVLSDGTSNVTGSLGVGSNATKISSPTVVQYFIDNGIKIKQINSNTGRSFIALDNTNTVWCWGYNGNGQVGNGVSGTVVTSPTRVLAGSLVGAHFKTSDGYLTNAKYVCTGNANSFAILDDGTVVSWGGNSGNSAGQLGDLSTVDKLTPVFVRTPSGSILQGVTKIIAGDNVSYALVDPNHVGYGTVYSWGNGLLGILGRDANGQTNPASSATIQSSFAGTVRYADNTIMNNIVDIAAGDVFGMALDKQGYIWSWGNGGWNNATGNTTAAYTGSDPRRVIAGSTTGASNDGNYLLAKSIGGGISVGLAVTLDNKPVAWGGDGNCSTGGMTGTGSSNTTAGIPPTYIQNAAGGVDNDVLFVNRGDTWGFYGRTDGSMYGFGCNDVGQLGIGNTTSQNHAVILNPPSCGFPTNMVVSGGLQTLSQNKNVANLIINPTGKLTLSPGISLTVNNLNIISDVTGTGTFVDNGTVTINGISTVQQYLTGSGTTTPNGRFWYISSPVTGATSATFDAAGANILKRYDEPTHAWSEIINNTMTLPVGTGYFARLGTTSTPTFTGVLNTGNINLSLSRSGTTDSKRGFNLVGNPYPSYLDWDAAIKTNVESTIWYRTNDGVSMVFDTYNAALHVGTNNNGVGIVTKDIPPMQAFWVHVDTDGKTGSLTFDNSMRNHGTGNLLKTDALNELIRLKVSNGTNSDEAIVVFNADATNALDAFDSEKMSNNDALIPELYTIANSQKLVINGLESTVSNPIIPLGFKTAKAGTFTISANQIEGLDGVPVVLEDKLLNISQDLTQTADYSFSSDSVNDANRFVIHLKSNNETTASKIEQRGISIYAKGNSAIINTSFDNTVGTVEVFNLIGQKVANGILSGTQTTVALPNTARAYFVKVKTDNIVVTKKIIVE
jgi:alpha-tubulin suppressor-like RCC1 family protein